MVQSISTNTFTVAKWVVSADATQGTHTTIASALTSASSGDTIWIRDGSYTENITGKAGVTITAALGDAGEPNVTIIGKCTFSSAGSFTISNIKLQTSSDFFLVVSGSNASTVYLTDCNLNCLNNTGISFTVSNAAANIFLSNCTGDLATTGIALIASSSSGMFRVFGLDMTNTGNSVTANTFSAGTNVFLYSDMANPITTTSTAGLQGYSSIFNCTLINTTALTIGGSGSNVLDRSLITSGSASAISIGDTVNISACTVSSSNTNAITGAGTIINAGIFFVNTSSVINTSIQTARNLDVGGISFDGGTNTLSTYSTGTFTPTVIGGSTAGTTTYTVQQGYYTRVGNMVTVWGNIQASAATGTGDVTIGALPFTIKNQANYSPNGSFISFSGAPLVFPVGTTYLNINGISNSITATIRATGTASIGANLQMANTSLGFIFNITYQI